MVSELSISPERKCPGYLPYTSGLAKPSRALPKKV